MGEESDLQIRCVAWFERTYGECSNRKYEEKYLLYSIPNEGKRSLAYTIKLKRMGMVSGMPDTHIAIAKKGFSGLYIEFKSKKGSKTRDQEYVHERLALSNFKVVTIRDFEEFKKVVEDYLN